MKFVASNECVERNASLPVRGAWVEMRPRAIHNHPCTSLPVRGAWVEIVLSSQ